MKRMMALVLTLLLAAAFVGCGKRAEGTTVTGMVTAVDGTVISLMEMDGSSMGGKDFAEGERPEMPEGMEGFEGFGDGEMPQWGEGEMPDFAEGEMPEFAEGEMPERPEGGERPQMPTGEDWEMQWPGGEEGEMPSFGNFEFDGETTDIDIGSAHISVEEDGVKASGTLEDITVGSFVTVTYDSEGNVTNVLVTGSTGFGGMGGFGGRGQKPAEDSEA